MNKAVNIEDGPIKDATGVKLWIFALIVGAILVSAPGALFARDRGVNQPGAAGNPRVHRDPGANQPGATGNVRRDPGANQPGAAGNVGAAGVDPGYNQPGATGNVGRDPGVNQPDAAGNRRGVRR